MKISILIMIFFSVSCNNNTQYNTITSEESVTKDTLLNPASLPSMSIIAIKGNHSDKASLIFKSFKYTDLSNDKKFGSLDSCIAFLNDNYYDYAQKNMALRGFWEHKGWTLILDPEMVDMTEETTLEMLSKQLNSEIFTFLIQETSGSYAFTKYNSLKQRSYLSVNGQVIGNEGVPLVEEKGLNLNQSISGDDILKLANKLGIDVQGSQADFVVKELHYK